MRTISSAAADVRQEDLLKRSTILILDDEPANVRMLERMLKRAGYVNVIGMTEPRAAVELYRSTRPDLLLLDLHMPDLNGLELMETLRDETPPRSFLPIIAITADTSPEIRLRALLLGVQGFLTKPIDYLDTILRIHNLLEVRRLVCELQYENEVEPALRLQERVPDVGDTEYLLLRDPAPKP